MFYTDNLYTVRTPSSSLGYAEFLPARLKAKEFHDSGTPVTLSVNGNTYAYSKGSEWRLTGLELPDITGITELHWQGGSFGKLDVPQSNSHINVDTFCQWKSLVSVSIEEVVSIMMKTCPQYNGFDIQDFSTQTSHMQHTKWRIAREGSVCLYGETPRSEIDSMTQELRNACVDEFDTFDDGTSPTVEFRAWWD